MKEIIVAIDFSKGSLHALRFAINISNLVGANIQMLYVFKPNYSESIFKNIEKDATKEIKQHFEIIVNKYQKMMKKGKLSFKIRTGKVYKEIINQAKYSDAYMIILGTHGVSGFEEFWIGSNAYKIVSSAPCPVITIRYGLHYPKKITKIVMPIDDSRDTRQKVPFVGNLAKLLHAEIYILVIYKTKIKEVQKEVEKYAEQAGQFLEKSNIKYYIEKQKTDNVANATIDYATKIGAELIACMTEQEITASNICLGTFAQQLVNHSKIPVISIHPKELYNIKAGI